MLILTQAAEPPTQAALVAPVFRDVAELSPTEPLAVLVRSTADLNWKPIVQQVLGSWATTGVAPGCADIAVDPEAITARDAIESLPIVLSADGARAEQGEALIRTATQWCGAQRKINVLVFFREGRWRGMNISVGDTMTGPRLSQDMMMQTTPRLVPVLDSDGASCRAAFPQAAGRLTATEVTSMTGGLSDPSEWRERWTWTACGRDTAVDYVLKPQADGSTRFEATIVPRP